MSHRKFEHPRHGSLDFLPRKRVTRHRGKGFINLSNMKRFGRISFDGDCLVAANPEGLADKLRRGK